MASEKWEVGLKREFPFLKYPTKVVKGRVTDDRQVGRNVQVKEEREVDTAHAHSNRG